MSQDSNFVAKLLFRWLITWAVLLGWWWGTWVAFNLDQIDLGIALGIGLPILVTLIAVLAAARRPSLEDEDA